MENARALAPASDERRAMDHPLDHGTREAMESRVGDYLGKVRMHTDAGSAAARPPAVRHASGTPDPLSTRSRLQPELRVNEPGDAYEQEADRVADAVMRMPERAVGPPLPRQPTGHRGVLR
jgi:hypothetical protein